MNNDNLLKGLSFIKPNSEWVWRNDDYNGLEWLDTTSQKPTEEEIQAGWVAYQAKVEADKAEAATKKIAAEAKLAALGLTTDDLKALGLN